MAEEQIQVSKKDVEQENQRLRKIILDNAANLNLTGEDKKFLMGVLFR
jgi:hypothetical protein